MKTQTRILESAPGATARVGGREYLYFVGTGYLGLQGHPEVIRAAREAAARYGIHSATTRAGFGNTPPLCEVEQRAAEFFGCPAAFVFSTGYASNQVLLRCIESDFDAIFVDEHSHYSVYDAAARCDRPTVRFRHRDAGDLAEKLRNHLKPGQRPLLMTDGVFSVRGTIAPLADYRRTLEGYAGAGVLVDDAHGVGVLGDRGRGTLDYFHLFDGGVNSRFGQNGSGDAAWFLGATLSKALGGYGGVIPGSEPFLERIRSASHWYDGATPPPTPIMAASARALQLADAGLRACLRSNVERMKTGLRALGFDVDDTPVPILCLSIGDAANMQRIQHELMQRGIAIAYMATYSGLGPEGGLRIAVFATHDDAMISRFLDELRKFV